MYGSAHSVHEVAAIREVERRAIAAHHLPEDELMRRAGTAAFEVLKARWPDARRITVACGPGNNGGDGRVLARLAGEAGFTVEIIECRSASAKRDRGSQSRSHGIPHDCDVIVDALFGIGLSRAPEGDAAALIDAINAHPAPVLALDVPSGLDADTGVALGPVVEAAVTVTFIAYKRGLFTADGPRAGGLTVLATLEVPEAAYEGLEAEAAVLPPNLAAHLLGPRPHDTHKGDCGHVLVIGGQEGMHGAALLAGEAALRCGAGLVSLAVAPGAVSARPELMVHEVLDAVDLAPLLERASVIAVGPGLGIGGRARALLDAALACGKPLVADADALNLLAGAVPRRADWIITPHPGEAARLLGTTTTEVQRDRFAAARELAAATGAVAVLKGAASLVAAPDMPVQACVAGNPGMASGGMGDVLTGVIAALVAQGLLLHDAARAGVQLHAEAGDRAAAVAGERGLLAGDLMVPLQLRVNGLV